MLGIKGNCTYSNYFAKNINEDVCQHGYEMQYKYTCIVSLINF